MAWLIVALAIVAIACFALCAEVTSSYNVERFCKWMMFVMLAVAIIAGATGVTQRQNEDERAIRSYLARQGYTVTELNYKYVDNGESYWLVSVYRTENTACGGDLKVKRHGDATTIAQVLSC